MPALVAGAEAAMLRSHDVPDAISHAASGRENIPATGLRDPTQSSRAFRLKPAGDSDAKQPAIPKQASRS
jgi:hypothetical protein